MYVNKKLVIIFVLISNLTFAQKASQTEVFQIAKTFLSNSQQNNLLLETPKIEPVFSKNNKDVLFYILNYEKAFIIISANKKNIPIKAFSFKNNFYTNTTAEINMSDILIADYEEFNKFLTINSFAAKSNENKWNKILLNKNKKSTNDQTFGPYLSSVFGQTWYYEGGNKIYTTNYYTPNHNPVGCVAITFTKVMRYYEWPRKGVSSYTYSDNQGSTQGRYSANFGEKYYNWGLILDEYKGNSTNENQRKELGKIAYHAAVSVNMDFESSGSTSNINRIPNAAKNYFRYIAEYKDKNESNFWQVLDSNMQHGIPAQFAIYATNGWGHAVVGDGIKYVGDEKYYHINTGWWGNYNGWYQMHSTFGIGTSPAYSIMTGAVLNMIPVTELDKKPKFNYEDKTAELKWYFSNRITPEKYELQYKKGSNDWETLTDTITIPTFVFQADENNTYTIRIRAKVNGEWYDNSWSNTVKIKPSNFKPKGSSELTLKPNVTSNTLIITYNNLSSSTIKVFNLSGELVFETDDVLINEYQLDVTALHTGIYIIQVSKDGEKNVARFLKL